MAMDERDACLYLSRYIIAHLTDYYSLLLAVSRDNAWEPWLLYMLRAVEETATWTTAEIGAIRRLAADTTAYISINSRRSTSENW